MAIKSIHLQIYWICTRLSRDIDKHGVLHVLRKGIDDRGVNLRLAWFKPSSGLNPEHLELYGKNRFITMELKNSLTGQFVENAVKKNPCKNRGSHYIWRRRDSNS